MNYGPELERICRELQEVTKINASLLRELSKPFDSNTQTPEQIHTSYLELCATYTAIDNLLKALFEGNLFIDEDSALYEERYTFHEHDQTMQNLMSELSSAYELYIDFGVCSGIEAWQTAFCEYYPDALRAAEDLRSATLRLLDECAIRASMSMVYASPEMMGIGQSRSSNAPYPINHTEQEDDLYMEELYGSPQIMNRISKDDYVIDPNAEVIFEEDETIIFCRRCNNAIPGSALICPYCGLVLR